MSNANEEKRLHAALDAQGKALLKEIEAKRRPSKEDFDAYSTAFVRWIHVRRQLHGCTAEQMELL